MEWLKANWILIIIAIVALVLTALSPVAMRPAIILMFAVIILPLGMNSVSTPAKTRTQKRPYLLEFSIDFAAYICVTIFREAFAEWLGRIWPAAGKIFNQLFPWEQEFILLAIFAITLNRILSLIPIQFWEPSADQYKGD
ncbi:MAG: hypothetical protein JOZ91_09820 [Candidatus Eremiobacteraeota bacterium]|nr:hypothetical protein [Candidatus Eremiobacteraeota bacterium]MBV8670261.1 hypothetical protein [Candidatus Eremiobacteraeota bacterium]